MAKYKILHGCGCTHVHDLRGPRKHRDAALTWMRRNNCWNCEIAALSVVATAAAREHGRPKLSGSPAEVAWAVVLREQAVSETRRFTRGMALKCGQGPVPVVNSMLKGIVAVERWLKAAVTERVDAGWWIAQRNALEDKVCDVALAAVAVSEPLDLADIEVMLACPEPEVRELGLLAVRMTQAA